MLVSVGIFKSDDDVEFRDINFRHMVGNSSVLIQKHMASELLNIYLEGLQDVFEHSSNLNLSEYILIGKVNWMDATSDIWKKKLFIYYDDFKRRVSVIFWLKRILMISKSHLLQCK